MDSIKKAYVDSRFRTRGSNSDRDFNFDLKEALNLPDNTANFHNKDFPNSYPGSRFENNY